MVVDDASHLYFKNMRAYYYDQETGPAEGTDLYRLRKITSQPSNPMLIPVIVDNWLRDEAYLLVETNDYQEGFAEPLTIGYIEGTDTTRMPLHEPGMPGQIKFARALAPLLEAKQDLLIQTAGENWAPIFGDPRDRLHFLTTLRDYNRLVRYGE